MGDEMALQFQCISGRGYQKWSAAIIFEIASSSRRHGLRIAEWFLRGDVSSSTIYSLVVMYSGSVMAQWRRGILSWGKFGRLYIARGVRSPMKRWCDDFAFVVVSRYEWRHSLYFIIRYANIADAISQFGIGDCFILRDEWFSLHEILGHFAFTSLSGLIFSFY